MDASYSDVWRAELRPTVGPPETSREEEEEAIRGILGEAKMFLPTIASFERALVVQIARTADSPDITSWSCTHLGDLALAVACAEHDPAALARFHEAIWPNVSKALAHLRLDEDAKKDLLQKVREELFMGRDGGQPKILGYGGKGPLHSWLGVVVVRDALKTFRGKGRVVQDEEAVLAASTDTDDPELSFLKRELRDVVKSAFRLSFMTLSADDRLLLRQHIVDGLSIDVLGRHRDVHRATIARWIQRAKADLLSGMKKRLADGGHLKDAAADEVLGLVWSRLDLTLRSIRDSSEEP